MEELEAKNSSSPNREAEAGATVVVSRVEVASVVAPAAAATEVNEVVLETGSEMVLPLWST